MGIKNEIKKIVEHIPQDFWENVSYLIIFMMFMILNIEALTYQMHFDYYIMEMLDAFYFVGILSVMSVVLMAMAKVCLSGVKTDKIKKYLRSNPHEIMLILLLIWMVISTVFSVNVQRSWEGSGLRQAGLRTIIIFAALYICGKNIKTAKNRKMLLWTLIITGLIQDISIVSEAMGYYGSIDASFWNSNYCGYFLSMCVMASAAMFIYEENKYVKLILMLIYPINLFSLIYNNTFGGYVAVAAGMIFMIFVTIKSKNSKKYVRSIMMILVIFIITNVYAEYKTGYISQNFGITGRDIKNISENNEESRNAGTGRMKIWIDGINCALYNPVTGCGTDNLDIVGKEGSEAHNELIQIAAENGFPALIFYMSALIILCGKKLKQIKNIDSMTIVSGCIVFTYLISSLFGNMVFNPAFVYYVFMGNLSISDD